MKIIGITGTLGAGKGTVVEYLKNKYNFSHFSVRDYLTNIIHERNLPLNRDTMVLVANELRNKNHPAYIIEQLYLQAEKENNNCVIESIRTPGEVMLLRQKPHFKLWAIDAMPEIRYKRIKERKSETDQVSYEEFLENEKREMNSTDPNHQNISACMKMADFTLINNGSLEELYNQIEAGLKKLADYEREE